MVRKVILYAAVWLNISMVQQVVAQQTDPVAPFSANTVPHLSETQKIDRLILYISNLQGATFIRNGNKYTPQEAANHLASKFKKHASKIKTAHDFIDKLASKSSVSGEPYQIRMVDGTQTDAQKLLNLELRRIEVVVATP